MNDRPEPMFLARETYRRRRLMDAARFLPFLGAFVFIIPALWAQATGTAAGKIYIFGTWICLICLAFIISRRLPTAGQADEAEKEPGRSGPG